jgi:hypothetical protein
VTNVSTAVIIESLDRCINAVDAILNRRERHQPHEVIGRHGAGA